MPAHAKVKIVGVIDDHTRLAYCEIHPAENATAVSATLRRAAAWMLEQGCGPVQAVMSDNALCYARSHEFRDTLRKLGAHHIRIPAYTPRWNGKIERFFQTLDTKWAHGRLWPNSATRDRALSSFMRYYNRRRPHTAATGRAPITRVQHLRRAAQLAQGRGATGDSVRALAQAPAARHAHAYEHSADDREQHGVSKPGLLGLAMFVLVPDAVDDRYYGDDRHERERARGERERG